VGSIRTSSELLSTFNASRSTQVSSRDGGNELNLLLD
jgi:hypothetical protein